jgi:hypothetical protein
MFKKMVMALILAVTLVIGHTNFGDSPVLAAVSCSHGSTLLAENPELVAACRYHSGVVSSQKTELARIIEVGVAPRYAELTNSIFLAANPELAVTWRYAPVPD